MQVAIGGVLVHAGLCGLGNHPTGTVIALSIPEYFTSGCKECWQKEGLWCDKHDEGFQGWLDGLRACIKCLDEAVLSYEGGSAEHFGIMRSFLSLEVRESLDGWIAITRAAHRESEARAFSRMIVMAAAREKVTPLQVIEGICETGSIEAIISSPF